MSGHRNFDELAKPILADPERRARVEAIGAAMDDALALGEIRKARGLTQADISKVLKVSQANVSRLEHEQNIYLSTLQAYVEALGGELELKAVFPDRDEVRIGIGKMVVA